MVSYALNEIDCRFRFLLAFEVLVNQLLKRVSKSRNANTKRNSRWVLHFDKHVYTKEYIVCQTNHNIIAWWRKLLYSLG
jgi:hypothetical protein